MERRIEVHGHEVLEVLGIRRGERVAGVVGECPGVHEVGQRAGQHLEEGVADGVPELLVGGLSPDQGCLPFAPTQCGMLQDVWHSGGIWRIGLEADGEDIVRILAGNVQVLGARLVVLEMQCSQLKLRHLLHVLEGESVQLLADARKVGDIGHSGIATSGEGGQPVGGYSGMSTALTLPANGAQHVRNCWWVAESRNASIASQAGPEMSEGSRPAIDDACPADWPRVPCPQSRLARKITKTQECACTAC